MPRKIYGYFILLLLCWAFWHAFNLLYVNWVVNVPIDLGDAPFIRAGRVSWAILLLIGLFSAFAADLPLRFDAEPDVLRRIVLSIGLLIFLGIHLHNWKTGQNTAWFWVEDVGTTTLAADRLVLGGVDPYAAEIDPHHPPSSIPKHGYKYLPVTMAVYSPALLSRDPLKAFLVVNLLLSLLLGAVLYFCVAEWMNTDAALLCCLLYLMPKIISLDCVERGTIDLIPTALAMLALKFNRRRLLSGSLVGLAIAAKLFPGPVWIPVLLTRKGNSRFLAGIALGATPILPFFFWNPKYFLGNILVFPFARPIETTSVWFGLPSGSAIPAQLAFLVACVLVARHNLRFEVSEIKRCAVAAALLIGLLLTSPAIHTNYYIWWFAPLCVTITFAAFNTRLLELLQSVGDRSA